MTSPTRWPAWAGAVTLLGAVLACGDGQPSLPTGRFELVEYLDRPLPTLAARRILVDGSGTACDDTLRAGALELRTDRSARQTWVGDVWCTDGRPAEPYTRSRQGRVLPTAGGLVLRLPVEAGDSTADTLRVRGSDLVWELHVTRSGEQGSGDPSAVDTVRVVYRRVGAR